MNSLNDFIDEVPNEYADEAEDEYKISRAAERRKNDWKHAIKTQQIRNVTSRNHDDKPLHYYTKNSPWDGYALAPNKTNNKGSRRYISKNYAASKNWNEHDKRQIDDLNGQLNELER